MTQTSPALDPEHLERLQLLTRDYAHYSRGCAGLGSVLGGIFAFLILAVDLIGHGGRITFIGAYAPLPLNSVLLLALLPFLWLGALAGLRAWWYQRHGIVEAEPEPPDPKERRRRLALVLILPIVSAVVILAIYVNAPPLKFLRAGIFLALMAAFAFTVLRFLHSRLERILGTLLFICPALIIAGIQMAAGDSLLALPVVGTWAVILGLREHMAYRRVEAQLAALRSVE